MTLSCQDLTGIILAGGKNTRMGGVNKAFLELGGKRLIENVLEVMGELFAEVIIVTNSPLEYLEFNATIVTDIYKERGSLGGIYTGLFYASHEYSFVVPCDVPFLDRSFIEYMVRSIGKHQIVVPSPPDGLQPLHAIYSRRTLMPIARLLAEGKVKIKDLYGQIRPLIIPADVIETFDPRGRMFFNINSPEDLDRYLKGLQGDL